MSEINKLREELLKLLKKEAFACWRDCPVFRQDQLFYLDGRCVTLNAKGAYLSARLILDPLKDEK